MTKLNPSRGKKTLAVVTAGKIASFVLFAIAMSFSQGAWADADDNVKAPVALDNSITPTDNNGGPNDLGYVDKSYHASDGRHIYKHPKQPSFTSPFDYGNRQLPKEAIVREVSSDRCNCFTFDATKSYEIGARDLSVMWDFGDGQTSDKAVVQHCYDKSGTYNVTLTVKDSSGKVCDTGVASTKVDASFPAQANAGPEQQACLNEAVTFNGTGSVGGPFTYNWDFGDSEAGQGATVTHTYKQAGQYRVLLTVDDGRKTRCSIAQASTTARIFQNASVSLQGSQATCVGRTASFEAQGSSGKYHWDFGDGQVWDGGSRASHSYAKSGTYTTSVTVDDGRGSRCSVASSAIKVQVNEAPFAKISDVETCLASDPVNFDASKSTSSNGPLSYNWNFGDGDTADGVNVAHTYQKSGAYRVILTVKDSSGSECGLASDSMVVSVKNRPEAVITVR